MPRKREWAWGTLATTFKVDHLWNTAAPRMPTYVGRSSNTPINEFDALMRTAPKEEARDDIEELMPLREALQDAIDALPPKMRWVFDGYYVRRLSLRQLAAELGRSKTQVARLRDEAREMLAAYLADEPLVKERLREAA